MAAQSIHPDDEIRSPSSRKAAGLTDTGAAFDGTAALTDGYAEMREIFVQGRLIAAEEFDRCWVKATRIPAVGEVCAPLIQVIADECGVPVEDSLDLIGAKSSVPVLPTDQYDLDVEIARSFPAKLCRGWCVLPFDKMSKTTLVATTNPFNLRAEAALSKAGAESLLWYLSPPRELMQALRTTFG